MWNIELLNFKNERKLFEIPSDDVTFIAALKREETVHNLKDGTFVRLKHLCCDTENFYIIFHCSLLEATSIELKYPLFAREGLMGKWKLMIPKQKSQMPYITLINEIVDTKQFLKECKSDENPDWIKKYYESF